MELVSKSQYFHTTEPIFAEKSPSASEIRHEVEKQGFETKEIRFAKPFFIVMVCKHPKLLPKGQHLVVGSVKNVISAKVDRNWFINFGLAEHCDTVVPLPPVFVNTIPEKIKAKSSLWLRECQTLYTVKNTFKKPKVVRFKKPIELVGGIFSSNMYVSANPSLVLDLDNNVKIEVSVDRISQLVISSENTIFEAKVD